MKKWTILLVCILALGCITPALANSWGVSGGDLLRELVTDHRWNDYISVGTPADDIAVLGTRYHNVLMVADENGMQTYTKAVFQPDDDMPPPKVTANESGFSIRYADDLWFSFMKTESGYRLRSAKAGELSVEASNHEYLYLATSDDRVTAVINRRYWLEDFNISLFPRTINEVRHLNWMREALDSESFCTHSLETLISAPGSGTAPVYSAPFGASAWRAAKGKAAVGLSGEMWKIYPFRNQSGEEYWCIRYDVSLRTQRIGFVERKKIESTTQPWEETQIGVNVPVTVIQETYLTDDPDVSQFAQVELPVNATLMCMGLYNEDYACVSAEVRDGRLAGGGQIIWGFVPLRDLQTSHSYGAVSDTALMRRLAGHWEFWAGGLSVGDYLTLNEDGTFETYMFSADDPDSYLPDTTGTWSVTPYNPGYGLYWNDPAYEITFRYGNGTTDVHGLTVQNDNEFSLSFWEGGGGYQRIDAIPDRGGDNG
ncbi:MAG: hypothetical protein IKK75_13410 [Clostridia bacterium]|nr:hypothetical protein [Clostridia bacterium]